MKIRTTRLVSMLLVLVMLVGLVPVSMAADDETNFLVSIGTAGYSASTFEEAWEMVKNGGILRMQTNAKLSKVVEVPSGKAITIIADGYTIDRGLKNSNAVDSGEAFVLRKNSSLTVIGGTVTGGNNADGGGAFHLQEKATLKLQGVTVTGNKTTSEYGGGAVRLQGTNARLEMDAKTKLTGNAATGSKSMGGAISITADYAYVVGENTEVSNNRATVHGGAVAVCNTKAVGVRGFIDGLKLTGNEAGENGGGVYASTFAAAFIYNCHIENNKAGKNGGGVYSNQYGTLMGDVTITGNTAGNKGGGIYQLDKGVTFFKGDAAIYGNTGSSSADAYDDNLFLNGTNSYIYDVPAATTVEGQGIHIGWDTSVRTGNPVKLSASKGAYEASVFRCDVPEYTIYWSWGTKDGKNDRTIRAAKSDKYSVETISKVEVPVANRYDDFDDYNGYDLQRGLFSYKATEGGDLSALYYFSEGYFKEDPSVYNEHLATMSLALTMSAFNSAGSEFDDTDPQAGGYKNRVRNAVQLLNDLGFKMQDIHVSESFLKKPSEFSIGAIMAAKTMKIYENGKPCILVPIAVRGAGYEMEWVSNVTLGSSGEAAGFSNAADQVMWYLDEFLQKENSMDLQQALDEGRVKFWVTGFSRSAATANLTAKRLTDKYGVNGNEIYAYCFEAPKGGVTEAIEIKEAYNYNGQYHNIHNIINESDIVPYVGPQEMGFFRYGVDHFVPGSDAGTVTAHNYKRSGLVEFNYYTDNTALKVPLPASGEYANQRMIMAQHLKAIDPRILFDDYFHLATMSYLSSTIFGGSMVEEIESKYNMTAAEWIPRFFADLQIWACNYTYNDGDKENRYDGNYRKFYSTHRTFAGMKNQYTVEESLQAAVSVVFGLDNTAELMDAMMYRLKKLNMVGLYWNVIWWHYENTHEEQQDLIDMFWNQLEKDMTRDGQPVPKLSELLTAEQYRKLEKAFPSLMSFLLQFVNEDYHSSAVDPLTIFAFEDRPTQVHVGTLAHNLSGVLQNHYPEICMAWLRSYDSFYTNEDGSLSLDSTAEYTLVNPTVASSAKIFLNDTINIKDNYTSGVKITMEPATSSIMEAEGSTIYYRLDAKADNSGYMTDWTLYEGPIYAGAIDSRYDTNVRLQVKVVRYQQASEIQEINFTLTPLRKNKLTVRNSFDRNARYFDVMAGEQITIQAPHDKQIWKWTAKTADGTVTDVIPGTDNPDATGDLKSFTITMPNEQMIYTVFYKKELSLLDMRGLRPVAGEVLPTAEMTMYAHQYDAYLTVDPATVDLQVQWFDEDGNDVTGQVAQENAAYTAMVTVTAYEAPENESGAIQPVIFTDATTANVMGAQIVVIEKQSDTVAVVTCDFSATQNAQTHTLDVQTYDLNLQTATTTEGNLPEDFPLEYAEGTTVSVPAPVFENMEFVSWTVSDEIAAANAGLVLTEQTLSFTVPYFEENGQTLTVTAQYKPVVNEIRIQIPKLEEGGTFPTAVTAADVTVRNTYDLDPSKIYVEWEPADETVVEDKNYTAYIYADQFDMDLEDGSDISGNVSFTSATKAYVNGEEVSLMFSGSMPMIVWDTSTSQIVEQIITDVTAPANISVSRDENGALPEDLELPAEVAVRSTNALLTSVSVGDWSYVYAASTLEAQEISCVGTLVIPEDATIAEALWEKDADPETEGFQVSLTAYIQAAPRADMPTATPVTGEYTGDVTLYAAEGSTIYYTVDGTTPTTSSSVYAEAISVEPTFDAPVTIKAIAVEEGKLPSSVASFTYTAPAAEDEATTFHVYGHNVRLQDVLRMGFYLYVETDREVDNFGVLVSTDSETLANAQAGDYNSNVTNCILTGETYTINGAETVLYTYESEGICPQNLDTVCYVKPYIRTNGQYIYGDVDDYSVLEYAQSVYANENSAADLKAIVMDLMNYATAARAYFCYTEGLEQPEEAFNSFMTDAEKAVAWSEELHAEHPAVEEAGSFDATFYGKNANILEAISAGAYFQDERVIGGCYWNSADYAAAETHDQSNATGAAEVRNDLGDGFVKLSVPGIYSFNIYDTYYLRGSSKEGELTDTYSLNVAAYLSSLIKNTAGTDAKQQALVDLCKAMQVYGMNAKAYFDE